MASKQIIIEGPTKLKGEVAINGAKNASLKLMAATLLGEGEYTIQNVPDITDVRTMLRLLESLGVKGDYQDGTVSLLVESQLGTHPDPALVQLMRASAQVMGPLLAKMGEVVICHPGGCAIGSRQLDIHIEGLKALGADIEEKHGVVRAKAAKLRGTDVYLDYPSVGATENMMMAAVLAEGTTTIHNAAREPEIIDSQQFLRRMGAKIRGAGTDRIVVEGVRHLGPCEYTVMPDRIEAGTFLMAGAMSAGDVLIYDQVPGRNKLADHLGAVLSKLTSMGADIEKGDDWVRVRGPKQLAPVTVKCLPYPGYPTDMQPQIMAAACLANGASIIIDAVHPRRFRHVPELVSMGADILVESNMAVVRGPRCLSAAPVRATDLRAGAALVLAGVVAEGTTTVREAEHIDRGYDGLVAKLRGLGAHVRESYGRTA